MPTRTPLEALLDLAADVMGHDRRTLPADAAGSPFITLGGTLEQAMRLQARAEERLRLGLDLSLLLGPVPLADALARAVPAPAAAPGQRPAPRRRPALPQQRAALAARPGLAGYRVLSAELTGRLDLSALRTALAALGERHEGLRTVFAPSPTGPVRHVLAACPVPLLTQPHPAPGGDPVAAAHARLAQDVAGPAGPGPADRAGRPPLAFVLTPLAADRVLLSFLYHEAVADVWSAALVWQELLADYGRAVDGHAPVRTPAPGPDAAAQRADPASPPAARPEPAAERAARPRDVPGVPPLAGGAGPAAVDFRGERLPFGLGAGLRDGVDATARRAGVPHSTVVLAAWVLALSRRTGHERLLIGTELPRRPTAALLRTVAPYAAVLPVRCELEPTTDYFLRGLACAYSEALAYADAGPAGPAQVTFAAHDELLPTRIRAGGITARFHHGHLGGVTAHAALTLLRWRERPLLALDFATSSLERSDAVGLAVGTRTALRALALSRPWTPVDDLLPPPAPARTTGTALPLHGR
ncbi:condensation domain-containing protein [Streptomyces brasiliensis]|uniref:Condensation domain-containing protein n=1 Tax=Streptomyces brasiliensis TaxID=1954 RepID=A0A917L946_9ACTN|nr:condensation domain-containing protein [Streptomyces brasiliensis]GGJ51513.1 hypothetical protein GCM10010121_073070 [Streptomyces brasiliensis]